MAKPFEQALVPKKRCRPIKHSTPSSQQAKSNPHNKPILKRKTVQEMEAIKRARAVESVKEKHRHKCNDRSRRHARQCAQASQKGNSLPSPLSSIPALLPSSSTNKRILYFICEQCNLPKALTQCLPAGINDEYRVCCLHYLKDSNDASDEIRWCYNGSQDDFRHAFLFDSQEHSDCNRYAKRDRPVQSPIEAKTLDDEAVSAKHWKLIERSNYEPDNLQRHACDLHNEMDFDKKIHMMNGLNECHPYRTKRENLSTDFIANFSKDNDMNPGVAPLHLHHRSIAEEMLIARAHVHVNF